MNDFYIKNKDFKNCVDKYARDKNISVSEALTHAMIKEIYKYYKERS